MYKSYWKANDILSVLECYVRFRVFFSSIKINSLPLHIFKVGAEIVRKSLTYPLKLTAQNVDVSVRVITEMVQTQICS
jgi:ribosomal protein S9